jgi:hypothetical protein
MAQRPIGHVNPRLIQNPPRELPTMRLMSDLRLSFRVNFFYREDFVYLYDELFTSGKMYSRSWALPLNLSSWLIPFWGAIAVRISAARMPGLNSTYWNTAGFLPRAAYSKAVFPPGGREGPFRRKFPLGTSRRHPPSQRNGNALRIAWPQRIRYLLQASRFGRW